MRHLLNPSPYNNPKPMTRWDMRKAWAVRWCRYMHGTLVEVSQMWLGQWRYDPFLLVILGWLVCFPPDLPAPDPGPLGHAQGAWIQIVVQIVIMIVAAIVAASMIPKTPVPVPAALGEFDVPMAEEGRPISKVFGEWIVKDPNVLGYFDLSTSPMKRKAGK